MCLSFDENLNLEFSQPSEYQLVVIKISKMMICCADLVYCKILTHISKKIFCHQSSIWFNNSIILPPNLDCQDKICFLIPIFVLISLRSAHSAFSSEAWEFNPMLKPNPIFPYINCHSNSFIEIIFLACLERSSEPSFVMSLKQTHFTWWLSCIKFNIIHGAISTKIKYFIIHHSWNTIMCCTAKWMLTIK